MTLVPGARVGPYEVRGIAGQGGMGIVYRARDPRLERDVAIKLVTAAPDEADAHARLLQEARHASQLNHPGIGTVHEVGELDGQPYIVMEYVDGPTLADAIPPAGLPAEAVMRYGAQIADAVAHAHAHGILHRDLKSGNIKVAPDGRLKVLDFGLARQIRDPTFETITRTGSFNGEAGTAVGTLPYMAPEVMAGRAADGRSDIWSLGVVLHEMVAGERPFQAQTLMALGAAIAWESPRPLPDRVPVALRSIIANCLRKEPAERYQSAAEVRAALLAIQDLGSAPAPHAHAIVRPMRIRQGPLVAVTVVGAIALAVGIAGWMWRDRSSGAPREAYELVSTFPGAHSAPSFSPDGRVITFVQDDSNGVPQIWIKNLAEGEPVQITDGDVPASRPRWSAGNEIVFARRQQGIWAVPPVGGTPRRLLERGSNPHVSANAMVFEAGDDLWMADPDGANARRVEGIPARVYAVDYSPALSPDGRQIAFFRAELGPNGDFWVAPAAGGDARRLTNDTREGGSPAWSPDGKTIVFSSARAGSRTLWRIAASGGTPEPLTSGAGEDSEPDVSADGQRLVYTNVRNTWGLRVIDTATGNGREILERRFGVLWPMFSPSGDRIAFFGPDVQGDAQVFIAGRDGANVQQLTRGRGEMNTMPRWWPDGESVLLYQLLPTRTLLRVPVAGGQAHEVLPLDWDAAMFGMVSPDGTRIAYTNRQAQPRVTIVRDVSPGARRETVVPLEQARWSKDGRLLVGAQGPTVSVCGADGAGCRELTRGDSPVWSGDDRQVHFLRATSSPERYELWRIEADGTGERRIAELGPFRVIDVHFDSSPRGEVVWTQFRRGRHELWLASIRP